MKRERAYQLRAMIEKASASLRDEDALGAVELFPVWQSGRSYAVGDRLRFEDKLYKVNQAHTSQADWKPDSTPALYTEVAKPGEILVWKQPAGAHDAYNKGDKVYYPAVGDTIYICTVDGNAYAPDVHGWEVYHE